MFVFWLSKMVLLFIFNHATNRNITRLIRVVIIVAMLQMQWNKNEILKYYQNYNGVWRADSADYNTPTEICRRKLLIESRVGYQWDETEVKAPRINGGWETTWRQGPIRPLNHGAASERSGNREVEVRRNRRDPENASGFSTTASTVWRSSLRATKCRWQFVSSCAPGCSQKAPELTAPVLVSPLTMAHFLQSTKPPTWLSWYEIATRLLSSWSRTRILKYCMFPSV